MTKTVEYLKNLIQLIRIRQWYKNLVIFLPLFFVGEILNKELLVITIYGFFIYCMISSANYIFNDIIDIKKDKVHSEKRKRPLASGKISIFIATVLFIALLLSGFILAYNINAWFFGSTILFFLMTTAYSLFLKNEPIIDILLIASNFVLRAVAGAFILEATISPWLILCPFFLAIFLAVAKRDADIQFLKDKANEHKEVLSFYTKEIINNIMIVTTACLIIAYSLYSFSKTSLMLFTIPIAIYTIFRYYALTLQGSEIVRNPEKIYKDVRLVIAIILWGLTLIFIKYAMEYTHLVYP